LTLKFFSTVFGFDDI